MLYGTCTKKPCTYSHNEDLVARKRVYFLDLIQKQIAASKPSAAHRQPMPHRASVMDSLEDDDEEL